MGVHFFIATRYKLNTFLLVRLCFIMLYKLILMHLVDRSRCRCRYSAKICSILAIWISLQGTFTDAIIKTIVTFPAWITTTTIYACLKLCSVPCPSDPVAAGPCISCALECNYNSPLVFWRKCITLKGKKYCAEKKK